MSSSLYRYNNQNSQSAMGNGFTDAPSKTLTHYGVNFTPESLYDATPGSDAWPEVHDTGWEGPDDSATPNLAGLSNEDSPN